MNPWPYKIWMAKQAKGLTLDAGCGPGGLNRFLKNCVFLDFSRVALKKRWQGRKRARILASVENIPFQPNVFDTVIASEVIEHTDNPNKFASEVYRVLKKRGKFMLAFPWHETSRTHKFRKITKPKLRRWLTPYFKDIRFLGKVPSLHARHRGMVVAKK